RITGEVVPPSPEDFPHFGSSLTTLRPARPGLPTFVSLPWTIATSSSVQPGQNAGFLGHGYDPLRLHQALPEVIDFTPDGLRMPADMTRDRLLPALDQSASALLDDLQSRGLLDETLVVLLSEFGRTPRINGQAGRDHWGRVFSIALAGAGIRGGQVYGASDRHAAEPADR